MKEFLTTKEVAEKLGLTQVRVSQLVKELKLDVPMIGGSYILTPEHLAVMKERHTKRGPRPKEMK